jgi:hypothetical protein
MAGIEAGNRKMRAALPGNGSGAQLSQCLEGIARNAAQARNMLTLAENRQPVIPNPHMREIHHAAAFESPKPIIGNSCQHSGQALKRGVFTGNRLERGSCVFPMIPDQSANH